ncbi:MAG: PAS domain S-box protein [Bacteroidales bacterium]|nr:PAS domain S-box protein [Bacteroidales bacterium]MBN2748217.1 PAS domain S-box protein [Bacteroidales bacterium]
MDSTEEIIRLKAENERLKKELLTNKSLIEKNVGGICVIQDFKVVYQNKQFSSLFGYSPSAIAQLNYLDLVHPKDRKLIRLLFQNSFAEITQKRSNSYTFRISTFTGETRWLKSNVSVIDWNGKPALLDSCYDITSQKEAEEKLAEEEQNFRTLVNNLEDLICILNPNGNVIHANNAVANRLEFLEHEMMLKSFPSLCHDKDRQLVKQLISTAFDGSRETITTSISTSKNKYIPVEIRFVKGKWSNQNVVYAISQDISERIEAEREIRLSEEKFSKAFQSSSVMMTISTLEEGRYIDVNEAFLNATGLQYSEIIGKTSADLGIFENVQGREILKREVQRKGKVTDIEVRINPKGKDSITSLFSAETVNIRDTECMLVVMSDITQRKLAEYHIARSLERQKIISDISYTFNNLSSFQEKIAQTLDLIGTYSGISSVFLYEDSLGGLATKLKVEWNKHKKTQKLPKIVTYPTSSNAVEPTGLFSHHNNNLLKKLLQLNIGTSATQASYIYPLIGGNHRFGFIGFTFESLSKTITDGDKELLQSVCNIISSGYERKLAEDTIKVSEQRFRQLSELLPEMVFEANAGRTITFANNYLLKSMGYTQKQLAEGIKIEDLFESSLKKKLITTLSVCKGQNDLPIMELEAKCSDGKSFPALTHINAIFSNGKLSRYMGIMVDITDRKQQEIELIRAKELAEEASKTKEQFLSTMSHEIRTPMNAVIGMTNILLQEEPKPEQMENLRTLKFSAENLLALLNDILDFSKIEAGKVELIKEEFSVTQLATNIINSFKSISTQKGITVSAEVAPDVPSLIVGDRVRLNQVITNLIGNAIKFTDTGEVTLRVKLVKQTKSTATIYFSVTDTGIGISKERQSIIFQEFTQAHRDTSRKFGGTGLGLAISQRLVMLQGGSIQVESQPNLGSKFFFSLTYKVKHRSLEEEKPQVQEAAKDFSKAHRVLLVEDNEINKIIAEKFLVKWGLMVDHAENGQIALDLHSNNPYDLILMDLEMPVMDGYEATEKIRGLADARHRKTPIVALTASAMQDVQKKLYAIGMNDYVLKPFNPLELKEKIWKYLET